MVPPPPPPSKDVFVSYHYDGQDILDNKYKGFGSYLIKMQLPVTKESISHMVEAAEISVKCERVLKDVVIIILNWKIL